MPRPPPVVGVGTWRISLRRGCRPLRDNGGEGKKRLGIYIGDGLKQIFPPRGEKIYGKTESFSLVRPFSTSTREWGGWSTLFLRWGVTVGLEAKCLCGYVNGTYYLLIWGEFA